MPSQNTSQVVRKLDIPCPTKGDGLVTVPYRSTHHSEEKLEAQRIVQLGMMGAGELDDAEKASNLRRVRLHIDKLATSTDHRESNA